MLRRGRKRIGIRRIRRNKRQRFIGAPSFRIRKFRFKAKRFRFKKRGKKRVKYSKLTRFQDKVMAATQPPKVFKMVTQGCYPFNKGVGQYGNVADNWIICCPQFVDDKPNTLMGLESVSAMYKGITNGTAFAGSVTTAKIMHCVQHFEVNMPTNVLDTLEVYICTPKQNYVEADESHDFLHWAMFGNTAEYPAGTSTNPAGLDIGQTGGIYTALANVSPLSGTYNTGTASYYSTFATCLPYYNPFHQRPFQSRMRILKKMKFKLGPNEVAKFSVHGPKDFTLRYKDWVAGATDNKAIEGRANVTKYVFFRMHGIFTRAGLVAVGNAGESTQDNTGVKDYTKSGFYRCGWTIPELAVRVTTVYKGFQTPYGAKEMGWYVDGSGIENTGANLMVFGANNLAPAAAQGV